ncbi:MAG: hypothetical protein HY320_13400 [Armatimonadetes bacterium]|nr:hypothetical protein [Armatimonadota bacterium]
MRKTAPPFSTLEGAVLTADLDNHIQNWLLDGEYRQHSQRTLDARRRLLDKFRWFLRQQEAPACGAREVRAFLAYAGRGHEQPEGRWENPRLRPGTVASYYNILRAFFGFLVAEGVLEAPPMANLRAPIARADQVQPFTREQANALLAAARKSQHPRRNEVLVMFLLDTGAQASEVCGLRFCDLHLVVYRDWHGNACRACPGSGDALARDGSLGSRP